MSKNSLNIIGLCSTLLVFTCCACDNGSEEETVSVVSYPNMAIEDLIIEQLTNEGVDEEQIASNSLLLNIKNHNLPLTELAPLSERIDRFLPKWDSTLFEEEDSFEMDEARFLAVIQNFVDSNLIEEMSTEENKNNITNRTVQALNGQYLVSENQNGEALIINNEYGLYCFVRQEDKSKKTPVSEYASKSTISTTAIELYKTLSIPQEELGELSVQTIGESALDLMGNEIVAPHSIARLAVINREKNGIPVIGSRFLINTDLRGSVYRIDLRWPQFKLRTKNEVVSREDVIAAINDSVRARMLKESIKEKDVLIAYKIVYAYDRTVKVFDAMVEYKVLDVNNYTKNSPYEHSFADMERVYLTKEIGDNTVVDSEPINSLIQDDGDR